MKKSQAKLIISEGNAKLHKSIGVWNLPAGNDAMGGTCNMKCTGCYAIKAQIRYHKNVPQSRTRKLELSKGNNFVNDTIASIITLNKTRIRIHESGDFYSQTYVNRWALIASSLPKVVFLAYTKQLSRFDFRVLKSLPNVIIIDSLIGGKMNFGTMDKSGGYGAICPATTDKNMKGCGHDCTLCYDIENKELLETKGIFFKIH